MGSYIFASVLFLMVVLVAMPLSHRQGVSEADYIVKTLREELRVERIENRDLRNEVTRQDVVIKRLNEEVAAYLCVSFKWSAFARNTWDYELMARLVECEAGGESFEVKRMVASTILNRINSPLFPNNLMEVMTAKNQFTPIGDGTAYEAEASDESYLAIMDAVHTDFANGALFFMNPDYAENTDYFYKMEEVTRGGGMIFFKPRGDRQ